MTPFLPPQNRNIQPKSDIFNFGQFFGHKRVKCYAIWIMGSDLESSHHLAYFRHPFDMIFTFWFWLPMHFQNFKLAGAVKISRNFYFCLQICNQNVKWHQPANAIRNHRKKSEKGSPYCRYIYMWVGLQSQHRDTFGGHLKYKVKCVWLS